MKVILPKANSFRKSAKEKEAKSEEYTVCLILLSKNIKLLTMIFYVSF